MLQFGSDPIAIVLGEVSHALALGQILAHEPVGVLVGASLSVVVRRGKVEPRLGRALERPVLVKLGAVVHGDRLMKRLMQKLLAARVRPYSIYQCDQVAGAEEFCTTVERGGWGSCGRCVVGRAASRCRTTSWTRGAAAGRSPCSPITSRRSTTLRRRGFRLQAAAVRLRAIPEEFEPVMVG